MLNRLLNEVIYMGYFYTFRLARWKRWGIVLLLSFLMILAVWIQREVIFSFFYADEPAAIAKGNEDIEKISLTFNISWGEERVHDILDTLEDEDVQATFFVSGEWAERHPQIVEKIVDANHELGMLGYRYKSYIEQDLETVREDLRLAKNTFEKMNIENMRFLRPPNGHFNDDVIELAESVGLQVVHWTVNPRDWENPGTENIVEEVMKETANGSIILLHASDSVKQTNQALEILLPQLKDAGYSFVSITELINQGDLEARLIE